MTAKFAECTLGQLYRVTDADGSVLGGPMRYLQTGLKDIGLASLGSVLAVMFMLLCIGASFGGGNAFQVGQSLEAIRDESRSCRTTPTFTASSWPSRSGSVIIGGIQSIGAVAARIVPFMCVAYVLAALYILVDQCHGDSRRGRPRSSREAFTPQAAYGGFLGVLVIGIQARGVQQRSGRRIGRDRCTLLPKPTNRSAKESSRCWNRLSTPSWSARSPPWSWS